MLAAATLASLAAGDIALLITAIGSLIATISALVFQIPKMLREVRDLNARNSSEHGQNADRIDALGVSIHKRLDRQEEQIDGLSRDVRALHEQDGALLHLIVDRHKKGA